MTTGAQRLTTRPIPDIGEGVTSTNQVETSRMPAWRSAAAGVIDSRRWQTGPGE